MFHRAIKRVMPLVLALLILASLPMTAFAAGADFDIHKTGSIRIQLRDSYFPDSPIGGTLQLHKVGDAAEINSSLSFVLTADFAASGISLADINASGLAQQLADYAAANKLTGQSVSADKNGNVTFSGLSTGLYLVVQTQAVEGYLTVSPFLVSLPMYSAEDGWDYNIEAAPKVQRPSKEPIALTVVKKWLDNNIDRPDSLAVNLLKEGELVETVVLTSENSWKHTWTGLDPYYKWEVVELVPDGYTASYSTYGNTVTITNQADWYTPPTDLLIQTGQLNWPVPVLACAGLALILIGMVLLRRRKQEV